jgi:hypothetical protein
VDKWLCFYRKYFCSEPQLKFFVESCEQLNLESDKHRAKIIMHQGQRLSMIADAMEDFVANRDQLKLLFLIIAAENISKLHLAIDKEGNSKYHVKRFFKTFCCAEDQQILIDCIQVIDGNQDINSVVDALYKIRCDVVHEGNYSWFDFATATRPSILSSKDGTQMIKVSIKYHDFKDIIVRGIIKATQDILQIQ